MQHAHLDDVALLALIDEDAGARDALHAGHVFECSDCRERLEQLQQTDARLRSMFRTPDLPDTPNVRRLRQRLLERESLPRRAGAALALATPSAGRLAMAAAMALLVAFFWRSSEVNLSAEQWLARAAQIESSGAGPGSYFRQTIELTERTASGPRVIVLEVASEPTRSQIVNATGAAKPAWLTPRWLPSHWVPVISVESYRALLSDLRPSESWITREGPDVWIRHRAGSGFDSVEVRLCVDTQSLEPRAIVVIRGADHLTFVKRGSVREWPRVAQVEPESPPSAAAGAERAPRRVDAATTPRPSPLLVELRALLALRMADLDLGRELRFSPLRGGRLALDVVALDVREEARLRQVLHDLPIDVRLAPTFTPGGSNAVPTAAPPEPVDDIQSKIASTGSLLELRGRIQAALRANQEGATTAESSVSAVMDRALKLSDAIFLHAFRLGAVDRRAGTSDAAVSSAEEQAAMDALRGEHAAAIRGHAEALLRIVEPLATANREREESRPEESVSMLMQHELIRSAFTVSTDVPTLDATLARTIALLKRLR